MSGKDYLSELVAVKEVSDHGPGIVLTLTIPGHRNCPGFLISSFPFSFLSPKVFSGHFYQPFVIITQVDDKKED